MLLPILQQPLLLLNQPGLLFAQLEASGTHGLLLFQQQLPLFRDPDPVGMQLITPFLFRVQATFDLLTAIGQTAGFSKQGHQLTTPLLQLNIQRLLPGRRLTQRLFLPLDILLHRLEPLGIVLLFLLQLLLLCLQNSLPLSQGF